MAQDADGGAYRSAFASCRNSLEALARASDEDGRLAARTWWVTCMGSHLCRAEYSEWRAEAAEQLPSQLTAAHTAVAVGLAGFEPMARCVLACGEAVGVQPDKTLDHVEAAGARQQAEGEWQRATAEVEPLRQKLQDTFLSRTSWLGRRKPALAASASEMGIDEVRVCQVYVYGLASRLAACAPEAAAFAESANMRDVNSPLLGYDEARWDPTADLWRRMEMCVHRGAAAASTDLDRAWRHGKG
mmetsp:Transcript_8212/g.26052  ORF Transcript_8212/g.26052 Transcript_8212/m.26052 type:complete len:244 (+) Transcript_8212:84-815(+)